MRIANLLVSVVVALGVAFAAGQEPAAQVRPASPNAPVAWTAALESGTRPIAGGIIHAVLTAKIEDGWHVYSLEQPPNGPSALFVSVRKQNAFAPAGTIVESKPVSKFDANFNVETHYFERTATITVPVRIAPDAPKGAQKLFIDVEYQVCSDRFCLPPAVVALTMNLTIAGGASAGDSPLGGGVR